MSYDLSLMSVGAHPDDEGGCSGVIAKYAEMGGRAYVVCATRGDGVDAKIQEGSGATRETLGQVRVAELECACSKLGAQAPVVLGYQDGEVERVDLVAAATTLARKIREVRPTVVITHGPEGGYGHPDHIAVSRFTTLAVQMAGDTAIDLGFEPFAPAKLYYTAFPRSYLDLVPAFRERRAEIGGKVLGFVGVPDEQITTEVDIKPWLDTKLDALSCHRTQFEIDPESGRAKTFSRGLPPEDQVRLFSHERFVLAGATANGKGREADLFLGVKLGL
jgi:LmbE family N-acetylglucosaminyl deacetylase